MEDAVWKRPEPKGFSKLQHNFRKARFQKVLNIISSILLRQDRMKILDAGGRAEYWKLLPLQFRKRIDLYILNYSDELESYNVTFEDGLMVTNVSGDACNMPQYSDGFFDLVHSNSVIEHVGGYSKMAQFADEIRRVGIAYYVQTPNYWFPIDPHYALPFLHWFPDTIRALIFSKLTLGFAYKTDYASALSRIEYCRMISPKMFRHFFPDGAHFSEKFFFMRKSLIAARTS